ncbi:MAG TPA: VWA domain-containing protein [Blastocatellia bacterium]|nr:VWA domain-containing protein [Blastocatellia bacterium]
MRHAKGSVGISNLILPPVINRSFFRMLLGAASRLGAKKIIPGMLLPFAFCLLPFAFPAASAQSGRQNPPPPPTRQPPSSQEPVKRPSPTEQETRPRRANTEDQDDKPLKLSADLVTVITSVTDAAGNQINDLSQNDFEIYEDNALQDIAGFYREGQVPLRLIFLFDTSSSIRHRFDFEQRAAAQFFRQLLRPGDQAAIMSVSSDPRLELQFTSDIDKLVSTLAGLKPEGATALYNSVIEAAKYIRPSEGRHVMIVLSDGTDTASATTLAQAMTEAQKSDAVIYGVHSTGIAPSANVQDLAGEFALKAMCEDTGGRAFFPPIYEEQKKEARDLDEIYQRVAAEVRAQFVLTYYSKGGGRPNTFKSIQVKVKRPGLQVRARRGYYSSK